jgi:Niemann-Pick C2 protein
LSFLTAKSIKNLKAKVRATALGVTVEYPLPEPNACNSLVDSACPIEAGDFVTYNLEFPISAAIPQVSIYFKSDQFIVAS